ncbi:MAG: cobalamin biosynthesis protein [Dehalogenimonas sp.]
MDIIYILTIALAIEFTIGDPPNALHPVAWLGKVISFMERFAFIGGKVYQFIYGVFITLLLTVGVILVVIFLLNCLRDINYWLFILFAGVLLKFSFSFFYLRKTALGIKQQLESGKLKEARFDLRGLVSRDTSQLSEPFLVSATVESVSESLCDSVVTPLFYFLVFGVPGALGFRVVSTFDSMVGYRGKYEFLGKFPARLDDVLNYIPARITAGLIILSSFINGMSGCRALAIARRDNVNTESPNAGWPMAAAAGALDVQFEKIGHYRLGDPHRLMTTGIIDDSLKLINGATLIWFVLCFLIGGVTIGVA